MKLCLSGLWGSEDAVNKNEVLCKIRKKQTKILDLFNVGSKISGRWCCHFVAIIRAGSLAHPCANALHRQSKAPTFWANHQFNHQRVSMRGKSYLLTSESTGFDLSNFFFRSFFPSWKKVDTGRKKALQELQNFPFHKIYMTRNIFKFFLRKCVTLNTINCVSHTIH